MFSDDRVGKMNCRDDGKSALWLFSAELNVKAGEVSEVDTDETIGAESFEHVDIDSVEVSVDADWKSDGTKSVRFSIDMLERNRSIGVPGESDAFGDCSGHGSDGRSCVEQSNNMAVVDCEINVNEFWSSDGHIGGRCWLSAGRCLC